MDERFVTIVGIDHYYGKKPFAVGDLVLLAKEPDNENDAEAVRVLLPRLGTVGYVANSPSTVARGTQSAGRIHDSFGAAVFARILFVTRGEVIARLEPGIEEAVDVLRVVREEAVGGTDGRGARWGADGADGAGGEARIGNAAR
jgi:hypothetical protein